MLLSKSAFLFALAAAFAGNAINGTGDDMLDESGGDDRISWASGRAYVTGLPFPACVTSAEDWPTAEAATTRSTSG